MTSEYAIFQHPEVQIYPSKAVFMGKTYFIPNITAVSVEEEKESTAVSDMASAAGCVRFLLVPLGAYIGWLTYDLVPWPWFLGVIAGIFLFSTFVNTMMDQAVKNAKAPANAPSVFKVKLDTNSGSIEVYSTKQGDVAQNIRAALEQAATARV
ncbi:DUF6232 family protein [Deinococcus sp. 12RED42]|uniref:DUF6232 family protein n=1 Tax=Deinococcus sp. 12RED42 TaxID=2745872 RepID=UPI001E54E4CC|nr:hypothetical protein [Deinococcus sp. 12RED42]